MLGVTDELQFVANVASPHQGDESLSRVLLHLQTTHPHADHTLYTQEETTHMYVVKGV